MMCRLCITGWKEAIGVHRKNQLYKKGEVLFSEDEPMEGIFFVYTGAVKVHKRWGEEKELIIRFATNGDIVGHRGLGKQNIYPVSATALADTIVCFIDNTFFQSTLQVNQELLYHLMMFFARELQDTEKNMRNLVHMQVKNRIAAALLRLQEQFGVDETGAIDFAVSRQDLASFVGTSYETLFRMLTEMAGDGQVKQADKKIQILNRQALLEMTI